MSTQSHSHELAALDGARILPGSFIGGALVRALVRTDDSRALAVARVALGAVMLPHGLQKAFGWFGGPGFDGIMGYLTGAVGLPWVLALLVVAAELLGSLLLLLGLGGRLGALGIASVMIGAVATTHFPLGFFMDWNGTMAGEGFEYHLLALGLAAAVMIGGSGAWSADRLLTRRLRD